MLTKSKKDLSKASEGGNKTEKHKKLLLNP